MEKGIFSKLLANLKVPFRSIRNTLTVWYVGVLAVILCAFSVVLYTTVATNLTQDVNKVLALEATSIAGSIDAFWQAERATPGNWANAPPPTFTEALQAGLVLRWGGKTDKLKTARPIRVLSSSGRLLGQSASFAQLKFPIRPMSAGNTKEGGPIYETFDSSEGRTRIVTYPAKEGKHTLYFVQVATSIVWLEDSLKRLSFWLLLLIPLTLVFISIIGRFLVSQTLRPVGWMTTQAQQISADDLHTRLDVPPTGDELERLGSTFNAMLARIEHAFKQLRQFTAAASHELRTPLTIMKGELEVSLRKPRTTEQYRDVLRTHLKTVDEMTSIVEELLALGRSGAVKEAVRQRPVEFDTLVQQVSSTWRKLAQQKEIHLEVSAKKVVWVSGEQRLLERLVTNLLDNAIRYTPSKGKVTVQLEETAHRACLRVTDTGPGIPQEELPGIFDRFFSQHLTSNDHPSTGLGLGLCRWIVEAHHGTIEVDSLPNRGTTFIVWLPLFKSSV